MPNRSRPRIAGQRRTSPVDTMGALMEPEATTKVAEPVETPVQDVRPATSEASEATQEAPPEAPIVTDSDGKSRSLGGVLSALLAVLVVLVLTFAVVLGIKAWQGKQAEDARDQAAAAGRKAAETALSYDYRDLNKRTKATVRADVREVGVRDGDADRVTLIIFVNQTTTSTITQGKPRVDLNRTRFVMVRKDGQWLVQEIAGL